MDTKQFNNRKKDHIKLALDSSNQASAKHQQWSQIHLTHEALVDLNFSEINLSSVILNKKEQTPFFISSMTAGHKNSIKINLSLAKACAKQKWFMGVGSQKKELFDPTASKEWSLIRSKVPDLKLLANIGISELISTPLNKITKLVDSTQATALIIHLNSLQELLQIQGTTNFKGSTKAISDLCKKIQIPVVVKETGCGFSKNTISKLYKLGVAAVDISGFGGTHWGLIEGARAKKNSLAQQASKTFADWGLSTVQGLKWAKELKNKDYPCLEYWASGGVRTGLEAAKALALGATAVGFAQPLLKALQEGEKALINKMQLIEYELKIALFCSGCKTIIELKNKILNKED